MAKHRARRGGATFAQAAFNLQVTKLIEFPAVFLANVVQANVLPSQEYGRLVVDLSIALILVTVMSLGVEETLQRALAANRGNRVIWAEALASRVLMGLLMVAAGLAFLAFGYTSAAVLSFLVFANSVFALVVAQTSSLLRPTLPSAFNVAAVIATSIAVLLTRPSTASECLTITLFFSSLRTIASVVLACRLLNPAYVRVADLVRMRNLADRGWRPLIDLTLYRLTSNVLNRQGDLIIAGLLAVEKTSVGTYALAFSLTTAANTVFLTGIGSLTLTRFSAIYAKEGFAALGRSWREMTYLTSFLSSWPLALLIACGSVLSVTVFHEKYAHLSLYLGLIGGVAWIGRISGGGANIAALFALREEGLVRRVFLMAAFANILTDLALMPVVGMYGAMIGTLVGTFFTSVFLNGRIRLETSATIPWLPLLRISGIALVSTLPILAFRHSVALSASAVFLSLGLWGVLSWNTKSWPPEISARLNKFVRRREPAGAA